MLDCQKLQNSEFSNCDRRFKIVCKQKGKRYELVNNLGKLVCKVNIDSGFVKVGEKCDYLLVICENKIAIFVELKGNHVSKACSQVLSTIEHFEEELKSSYCLVYTRIVSQSVPNIPSSNEIKLKQKLIQINKKWKEEYLVKKSKGFSELLEELIHNCK